jgi:transcriptional regulator with XRE-family HTH domain
MVDENSVRDFCKRARAWRKSKKIPIERVALACSVTGQTVRNFESGIFVNHVVLIWYLWQMYRTKPEEIKKELDEIFSA